jgi:hypothetical protein
MTAPKAKTEQGMSETRVNLRAKYDKFLAEGGAGRSNTNELLAAIIEELITTRKIAAEEAKKVSDK